VGRYDLRTRSAWSLSAFLFITRYPINLFIFVRILFWCVATSWVLTLKFSMTEFHEILYMGGNSYNTIHSLYYFFQWILFDGPIHENRFPGISSLLSSSEFSTGVTT
jgi:hypothetical protein